MNEKGEGPDFPGNITPIREGVIPEPNNPPKPEKPGKRKFLQAAALLLAGIPATIGSGLITNNLTKPNSENNNLDKQPANQPMKSYSKSPQYAPTPTEEDKRISDEYRQKHQQMLNNPDAPGSKIEGIQHPQSTATPYPNSPAHKIK